MIPTRVKAAIAIMERAEAAQSLYMPWFQGPPDEADEFDIVVVKTEAELHTCGNSACFAGHIAVSPEFQADGGWADGDGQPNFLGTRGFEAVAAWLGISYSLAQAFVYDSNSKFYRKPFPQVEPRDVIQRLELVLSGELVWV